MTGKRKKWLPREYKRKVTFLLTGKVLENVQAEALRRKVTQQDIYEAAVNERYTTERLEDRDALIIRRLNVIDSRLATLQRILEVVCEVNALYVRMWLSSTPDIPEEQRAAAARHGRQRYERYLSSLSESLNTGKGILTDLFKDVNSVSNEIKKNE